MTFWCLTPSVSEHLVHLKQILHHLEDQFGLPVIQAVADVHSVDAI